MIFQVPYSESLLKSSRSQEPRTSLKHHRRLTEDVNFYIVLPRAAFITVFMQSLFKYQINALTVTIYIHEREVKSFPTGFS